MRCRKCGKDNPEGSQFCGYCGEALQQDNMNLQTKMNGGEDKKEQKKDPEKVRLQITLQQLRKHTAAASGLSSQPQNIHH